MAPQRSPTLTLLPVYDDWEVLTLLLAQLDEQFLSSGRRTSVLVVNDGSRTTHALRDCKFRALDSVEILHLRRNVGHQRAIALGLAYIEANIACDTVVVMDADGEDTPADALRMLERSAAEGGTKAVFAMRENRSEGPVFRLFYIIYRSVFRVLTGQRIRFGDSQCDATRCTAAPGSRFRKFGITMRQACSAPGCRAFTCRPVAESAWQAVPA